LNHQENQSLLGLKKTASFKHHLPKAT